MSAPPSRTNVELPSKPESPVTKLHVTVGIPGCGKSTFAEGFTNPSTKYVATDDLREQIADDVNDQSHNDLVFPLFHGLIGLHLATGNDVIADSTALSRSARFQLRSIADALGAETHIYFFRNPLEAVRRNQARERVVPYDVMRRMVEQYERTCLELPQERYTSVTEIRSFH